MATTRELALMRQNTFGETTSDFGESFFLTASPLTNTRVVRADKVEEDKLAGKLTKESLSKKRNHLKMKIGTQYDIVPLVQVEEAGIVYTDDNYLYTVAEFMITAWQSTKASFEDIWDFQGHTGKVTGMTSYPGLLFSASEDGTMRVWDTDNGECIYTLYSDNAVGFTAITRRDTTLYIADEESSIQIFNFETRKGKLINVDVESRFYELTCVEVAGGSVWTGGKSNGDIRGFAVDDNKNISSLKGHTDAVVSLAEHDDIILLSGSRDGTIRKWDLIEHVCLGLYEGSAGTVYDLVVVHGLVISCDAEYLRTFDLETNVMIHADQDVHARSLALYKDKAVVSSGLTDMIEARQLRTAEKLVGRRKRKKVLGKTLSVLTAPFRFLGRNIAKLAFEGHSGRVTCIDAFRDRVYTGSVDATVRVWDVDTGACVNVYYGHQKSVTTLQYRGNTLFSADVNHRVIQWDIRGRVGKEYLDHSAPVRALYVTTGARVRDMYTGCDHGVIVGRSVTTVDRARRYEGHSRPITYLLEEAGHLFSSSTANDIRIWNTRSTMCIHRVELSHLVQRVLFAHAKTIVTLNSSNTLQLWSMPPNTLDHCLRVYELHSGVITSVRACGALLLSTSDDHTMSSINVLTGELGPVFVGHTDWVQSVTHINDQCIISGGYDGVIKSWGPDGSCTNTFETPMAKVLDVLCLAQDMVAVAGVSRVISIMGAKDGLIYGELEGHEDTVTALALGGNYLYSSSFDGSVLKWDLENEVKIEAIARFSGHEDRVLCVAVVGKKFVFAGGHDGTILEWDADSGKQRRQYRGPHAGSVQSVQVDWDPKISFPHKMYSAGSDGNILVWNCATGLLDMVFEGHVSTVKSLQLYGGTLFSGSADCSVRAWRTGSKITPGRESAVLPSGVNCADVSPSVRHAFIGCEDKTARKYHWNDMEKDMSGFVGHERAVTAIKYVHPHVLTGCDDGSARLWTGRTQEPMQQFRSAIQSPIWVFFTLVIVIVEFAQLWALPFVIDVPWSESSLMTTYVLVYAQVITADIKSAYIWVFFAAAGWILLFLIFYAADVAWDTGHHLRILGRRKAWARVVYRVVWFVLWSTSTLLFVPLFRALVVFLDCSNVSGGEATLDIAEEVGEPMVCWTLPHLVYATIAIIISILYVPATLRLAIVEGDIGRVYKSFWRWNRDDFMLENQHASSRRGVTVELFFYSTRTAMIMASILFTNRANYVVPAFFGTACFLFFLTILMRPYFDYRMNSFYLSLIVQIMVVNAAAYTVMELDSKGEDTSTVTTGLFIIALPSLLLFYYIFKGIRLLCLPCFENTGQRGIDDEILSSDVTPLGASQGHVLAQLPPLLTKVA